MLLPTTKAQVSGHKFLIRRAEHGLVLGDIRMIHDPLASRERAIIFGVLAVVLAAIGTGLLAWLSPDPKPGDAPLVRSAQGQLYVLIDSVYHPVPNLASARLILGEPVETASIGDSALSQSRVGIPLGITQAPGHFARADREYNFAACVAPDEGELPAFLTQTGIEPRNTLAVVADFQPVGWSAQSAALVTAEGKDWVLTTQGRALLADDPVIHRALRITEETPRWEVPIAFLNAVPELPAYSIPQSLPDVVEHGGQLWTGDGRTLTHTQAEILRSAGARLVQRAPEIAGAEFSELPKTTPTWFGPEDGWLCSTGESVGASTSPAGLVELPVGGSAHLGAGLGGGAVAVDTGQDVVVVDATGVRYGVARNEVEILGAHITSGEWSVLRLLPPGPDLNRESALTSAAMVSSASQP
ncbi:MAG: type VII secretion protein EccB [Corynebacterium sp.]|nr:type VII secretion protein EccB [Corynebacterium sp.]